MGAITDTHHSGPARREITTGRLLGPQRGPHLRDKRHRQARGSRSAGGGCGRRRHRAATANAAAATAQRQAGRSWCLSLRSPLRALSPPPPALAVGGRLSSSAGAYAVGTLTRSTLVGCFQARGAEAASGQLPRGPSSPAAIRVLVTACSSEGARKGTAIHPFGVTSGKGINVGGQAQGVCRGAMKLSKGRRDAERRSRQDDPWIGGSLMHVGGCETRNGAPVELQNQSHAMI